MHDAGMWTDLLLPGHFFFQGSLIAVYEIVRTFNLFNVFLEFPPSTICMNTIFPSDHFHVYWIMSMYTKWIFSTFRGPEVCIWKQRSGWHHEWFHHSHQRPWFDCQTWHIFFHILSFCTWALSWIFHILLWDWGLLGNTEVFSSHSKRNKLQCVVSLQLLLYRQVW